MDIILELFDTFVFDPIYAQILPASPRRAPYGSFKDGASNATLSSRREIPTSFVYEPASQYLSFTPSKSAYMSSWNRDNIYRQAISLYLITWLFGLVIYFVLATFSYIFVFDKAIFSHPKFLKNQIRMEIRQTMESLPVMAIFTLPIFLIEVRGYSKLYDTTAEGPGMWYNILQFPIFICFTDFFVYWIHRGLHHPLVYKRFHKPHHKWIMATPFASHAFHPVDGYSQGIPYHVFPFLFPLQKFAYVALFVFVNIWTVLIHDGEYVANSPVINGAACHTMHHLYFNYNYGQFTTLWDRLGGSYRKPNEELFNRETKMGKKEWERQSKETEALVKQVEGTDDRSYGEEVKKIQ